MKEKLPEGSPLIETIRVGDRLANRYTGVGVSFNIGEEIVKSRKLGVPTFEAVYRRWSRKSKSGKLIYNCFTKITPGGEITRITGFQELYSDKSRLRDDITDEELMGMKTGIHADMEEAEIVVIPTHSFQTPDTVALLSKRSSIDEQFEKLLSESIDVT